MKHLITQTKLDIMKKETLNLQTAVKLIEALSPKNSITITIDSCNLNSLKESSITHLVSVDSATALKHLELYKGFPSATVSFLVAADMFDYGVACCFIEETIQDEYTDDQKSAMWHEEQEKIRIAADEYFS